MHTRSLIKKPRNPVYTQLSDVEDEVNGFVTYDRKVMKIDQEMMIRINRTLKDAFAEFGGNLE